MNDILMRLRKVFNDTGESQTSIAKKLDVTSAYIWKILNKENVSPRKSFIESVCKKFNINEDWMWNGVEPMKLAPKNQLSAYVAQIIHGNDDFIREVIEIYMELDDSSKEALKVIADKMVEKRKGGN